MDQPVRVRFAPSPTGPLHIGGVRTALYNYLLARKTGGTFILRLEDTDQNRFVPGAEAYILEALQWCGIMPDEGLSVGGPYAPYRQSERKDMYRQYAEQLVDAGHAYYAFDTPEELEAMRERLREAKVDNPQYNAISRMQMKNSLTLSAEEVKAKQEAGEPYVVRLKIPRKEEVRLYDMIRGWVLVHSSTMDDKVLLKADGMPTYHLANVVDDYLMKITHVIRGEEWLPSAPLHVLLYRYLGWEDVMPQFAHLPLLLKPDGNGKLSKRDAEKHGFPIFPLAWTDPNTDEQAAGFREEGYLPEALINFLALLGWNPGTEQELFTMEELVEVFSLERINKAGTRFDIEKAKWFNQHYLRQRSVPELAAWLRDDLAARQLSVADEVVQKVVEMVQERITFPQEMWQESYYVFEAPTQYDDKVVASRWTATAVQVLEAFAEALSDRTTLSPDETKALLNEVLEKHGVKMGKVMQALRLAVTGVGGGLDLMQLISLLGGAETARRIQHAVATLKPHEMEK